MHVCSYTSVLCWETLACLKALRLVCGFFMVAVEQWQFTQNPLSSAQPSFTVNGPRRGTTCPPERVSESSPGSFASERDWKPGTDIFPQLCGLQVLRLCFLCFFPFLLKQQKKWLPTFSILPLVPYQLSTPTSSVPLKQSQTTSACFYSPAFLSPPSSKCGITRVNSQVRGPATSIPLNTDEAPTNKTQGAQGGWGLQGEGCPLAASSPAAAAAAAVAVDPVVRATMGRRRDEMKQQTCPEPLNYCLVHCLQYYFEFVTKCMWSACHSPKHSVPSHANTYTWAKDLLCVLYLFYQRKLFEI